MAKRFFTAEDTRKGMARTAEKQKYASGFKPKKII
jgi:hypothetical protein